jgi:hypothetical protein
MALIQLSTSALAVPKIANMEINMPISQFTTSRAAVVFGIAAAIALKVALTPQSTLAASSLRNIIVIMTDDRDSLDPLKTMPELKRELANNGVRFENSFVEYSLCCPSRVSFLTGMGAHNHGVVGNRPIQGGGYEAFYDFGLETEAIGTVRLLLPFRSSC